MDFWISIESFIVPAELALCIAGWRAGWLYKLAEPAKGCCSFGAAQLFTFFLKNLPQCLLCHQTHSITGYFFQELICLEESTLYYYKCRDFWSDSKSYQNIKIEGETIKTWWCAVTISDQLIPQDHPITLVSPLFIHSCLLICQAFLYCCWYFLAKGKDM